MADDFFVYEDWTNELSPRCFYVGKGNSVRLKKEKRNEFHEAVCECLGWHRHVVYHASSSADALAFERSQIALRGTYFKSDNYNGIGCNRSPGGGRAPGYTFTIASRLKMRLKKLGMKVSDETKQRCTDRNNRRYEDPVQRDQARQHANNLWNDPVHRQNITQQNTGAGNRNSKLTDEIVITLRREWDQRSDKDKRGSKADFCSRRSEDLGVSSQMIFFIINRKSWKHLP